MDRYAMPINEKITESNFIAIIITIFCILLTLVIFALWRRRKSLGHSVLIAGLSDAGKTLIYARLIHSKFVYTHTSIKENIGNIAMKNNSLRIVDIPGHERLRYKYFDKYKSSARALIFVIDSLTIQRDIRDVAEFLYTLLLDLSAHKSIPVLILCNKQDQAMAKGSEVIRTLLEKEMNLLRLTKSNQLESTDASSSSTYLGKEGKKFEFSHLNLNIQFAECSAFNKEPNTPAEINELSSWLQQIA